MILVKKNAMGDQRIFGSLNNQISKLWRFSKKIKIVTHKNGYYF